MTVYISESRAQICKLIADNSQELDALVAAVGLATKFKIDATPHCREFYAVPARQRDAFIDAGAVGVSVRAMLAMEIHAGKTGRLGSPSEAPRWPACADSCLG
jgi:hypothetical protein